MSEDKKKDTDPEDIIRARVIFRKDKVYFTLGEKSFMSHFPNESAFDGKEVKEFDTFCITPDIKGNGRTKINMGRRCRPAVPRQ